MVISDRRFVAGMRSSERDIVFKFDDIGWPNFPAVQHQIVASGKKPN
jgi:hypothetical protein